VRPAWKPEEIEGDPDEWRVEIANLRTQLDRVMDERNALQATLQTYEDHLEDLARSAPLKAALRELSRAAWDMAQRIEGEWGKYPDGWLDLDDRIDTLLSPSPDRSREA
jgi:hypothetical protein